MAQMDINKIVDSYVRTLISALPFVTELSPNSKPAITHLWLDDTEITTRCAGAIIMFETGDHEGYGVAWIFKTPIEIKDNATVQYPIKGLLRWETECPTTSS